MKRKKLQKIVEDRAHQAADLGTSAFQTTVTKLSPYVEQAGEKVAQAGEKVAPLAHDAKVKSAAVAVQALEAVQPHIEDALAKIAPAVEAAREKVTEDLMPKVTHALHDAAEHPVVKEGTGRVTAAAAALAGKEVVVKKKRGVRKTLLVVTLVGAALGGALVLIRKLTESKSGWEAHEPSPAYTPPKFNSDAAAADMASEGGPSAATAPADEQVVDEVVTEADVSEGAADVAADLGVDVSAEPETVDEATIIDEETAEDMVIDPESTDDAAEEPEEGGAPFRS